MSELVPILPEQDAHKDGKGQKGRKRKFGPLDTKHTVTSVVFLQQDHIVATSGPLAQPFAVTPATASNRGCAAPGPHDGRSADMLQGVRCRLRNAVCCAYGVRPLGAGAGDRDDVVKFWDIRKVQGPAATVQAPQQVC